MKRIVDHSFSARAIRLSSQDLDKIFEIIADGDDNSVSIENDGYRYSSLAEWRKNRGHSRGELVLSKKKISGSFFLRMALSFSESMVSPVQIFCSSEESEAAYLRIKDILLNRKRIGAFIGPIFLALFGFSPCIFFQIFDLGMVFLSSTLSFLIYHATSRMWPNAIELSPEGETSTFWDRNQDKIVLCVITTVVAGTIGYFLKDLLS